MKNRTHRRSARQRPRPATGRHVGDFSPCGQPGAASAATDFRTNLSWAHMRCWTKNPPLSGLHDVYTEKASAEHYRKTGKQFPDGATLVKIRKAQKPAPRPPGDPVVWGSDAAVWFVMVGTPKAVSPATLVGRRLGLRCSRPTPRQECRR